MIKTTCLIKEVLKTVKGEHNFTLAYVILSCVILKVSVKARLHGEFHPVLAMSHFKGQGRASRGEVPALYEARKPESHSTGLKISYVILFSSG